MIEIKTSSEISLISRVDSKAVFMQRTQTQTNKRILTDVFGGFWSVACSDNIPEGTVFLHRHGKAIEIKGNIGLFVPPHSILEWEFKGENLKWQALLIEGEPPKGLPLEPCLFDLPEGSHPADALEMQNLIPYIKPKVFIGKEEKTTPLAVRVKDYIDKNGLEMFSLTEMTKQIGCSLGSISRAFKQCYGVTPVYYRNQLRVFAACLMLLKGGKVTDVGHDVGFYDLGRFNKQFRKRMNAVPSQFIGSELVAES